MSDQHPTTPDDAAAPADPVRPLGDPPAGPPADLPAALEAVLMVVDEPVTPAELAAAQSHGEHDQLTSAEHGQHGDPTLLDAVANIKPEHGGAPTGEVTAGPKVPRH